MRVLPLSSLFCHSDLCFTVVFCTLGPSYGTVKWTSIQDIFLSFALCSDRKSTENK